jgi:hypothetical protein
MTTTLRRKHRLRSQPSTTTSAEVGRKLQDAAEQLRQAASGRAEAALRICRDAAECQAWHWLKQSLKSLRTVCNAARDDDVFEEWVRRHSASPLKSLRRAIRLHRAKVQPRIVKLAGQLSQGRRFDRRSQKVVKRLKTAELKGLVAPDFGRQLFADVSRFVQALPTQRDDASALHRLRIIGSYDPEALARLIRGLSE